jgi:hypothetical protein
MFHIKDHKTIDMFDNFSYLGAKRRGLLSSSWAQLFRDEILRQLPVDLLKKYYSTDNGRPTNELYAMMGAMILQQMHDLTDEQTVEQFCFNIQWHYALNITNTNDTASYVCARSIWEMRHIMTEHSLYQPLFERLSDHLGRVFDVNTSLQRLDSLHVFSNMRHLGRVRLFAATISKFLINLKRHHKGLFADLPEEMIQRYLAKNADSVFSLVKPSDASSTLEELAIDLFFLVERFNSNGDVAGMTSFSLLTRLLSEQCTVTEDEETRQRGVAVKQNREVASDSLQNPSDTDASYDGHKGKGYQTQVAETYSKGGHEGVKPLNLITHLDVEPAHTSDVHAVIPYLDNMEKRDILPDQVLADSLYGSDSNTCAALECGVDIVSPVMGGSSSSDTITLADFSIDEKDVVTLCPAGYTPIQIKQKGERFVAHFIQEFCDACPRKAECPATEGKRGRSLRYDRKAARLAKRRAKEKTTQFRDEYRFRSGIEATMSEFDRRTGVKNLRVRGLKAVRFSIFLKAAGLNILRAAAHRANTNKRADKQRDSSPSHYYYFVFTIIKEQLATLSHVAGFFHNQHFEHGVADDSFLLQTAA